MKFFRSRDTDGEPAVDAAAEEDPFAKVRTQLEELREASEAKLTLANELTIRAEAHLIDGGSLEDKCIRDAGEATAAAASSVAALKMLIENAGTMAQGPPMTFG